MSQYIYNFFLALDQMINAILLGDPDESLSGRLGRAKLSRKPKFWVGPMIDINDFLWWTFTGELQHSINAVEKEETFDKELWKWHS